MSSRAPVHQSQHSYRSDEIVQVEIAFMFYIIGALLLLHATYSSFELHQVLKISHLNSASVPLDIIVEVGIGLVLILAGAIKSIENPSDLDVQNKVQTPKHRFLKDIEMRKATVELEATGFSEYQYLELRVDFIDIVEKRRQHAAWIEK